MSWTSFEHTLEQRPSVAPAARRVVAVLRDMTTAAGADPMVIASRAGLDLGHTMAALGLLLEAGLGVFRILVLNDRGQPVREFASLKETPPEIEDDYGREIVVEPRNTRIVFRPSWA